MRVLLLLSPDSVPAPLIATLIRALAGAGVTVASSPEVNPDLDGYDLVHILATGTVEHAIRQAIHARRWGCPLVVTPTGSPPPKPADATHAPERYERAVWDLLVRGADRVVAFPDGTSPTAAAGYVATTVLRAGDPDFGVALAGCYGAAREEYATMQRDGDRTAQWLPSLPPEEYGKHLEDLVQLQLELIAYRDAEYDQLRHRFEEAQRAPHDRELSDEYARLAEWSRELAARHEALQEDYARLQRWSGELELRLQRTARGGGIARIAGMLRRR